VTVLDRVVHPPRRRLITHSHKWRHLAKDMYRHIDHVIGDGWQRDSLDERAHPPTSPPAHRQSVSQSVAGPAVSDPRLNERRRVVGGTGCTGATFRTLHMEMHFETCRRPLQVEAQQQAMYKYIGLHTVYTAIRYVTLLGWLCHLSLHLFITEPHMDPVSRATFMVQFYYTNMLYNKLPCHKVTWCVELESVWSHPIQNFICARRDTGCKIKHSTEWTVTI